MSAPIQPDSRPQLAPGCRLSESPGSGDALMVPEGILKLTGSGRAIIALCDGRRTFSDIVGELAAMARGTNEDVIQRETAAFLERLRNRGAVEY